MTGNFGPAAARSAGPVLMPLYHDKTVCSYICNMPLYYMGRLKGKGGIQI